MVFRAIRNGYNWQSVDSFENAIRLDQLELFENSEELPFGDPILQKYKHGFLNLEKAVRDGEVMQDFDFWIKRLRQFAVSNCRF